MKPERFAELVRNPNVVKADTAAVLHFSSPADRLIITMFWAHKGVTGTTKKDRSRFSLFAKTGDSYDLSIKRLAGHALDLDRHKYLLVNVKRPELAILYSFILDREARKFRLKLEEYPSRETDNIGNDEKEGFEMSY